MFKSFFGDRKSRKVSKKNQRRSLSFESLEARALMANDIQISGGDFVTSQDGDKAIFSVRLSDAPVDGPVKIRFNVSDLNQAKIIGSSTLTFTAANFDKPKTLTVKGVDKPGVLPADYTVDGAVTSDGADYANAEAHIALHNVDNIGEISRKIDRKITTEEGGAATIKLKLNFAPTSPVTINLESTNPAEGVPNVNQVVFVGTEEHEIKIIGQADGVKGANAKYKIVFDPAISDDLHFVGLKLLDIKMSNKDQKVTIKVSDKSLTTNELGGTDQFSVVLSQKPTAPVDVPIEPEAEAFVTVDKPVLHFDDQNWNVPQIVTVTGHDDGQPGKKDIKYDIDLLPAVSEDPKYAGLDVKSNLVKVKNVHRYDAQFDGHYVGGFSGVVMGLFQMNGTLDATVADGVVTLTSLSVVIEDTPLPPEFGGPDVVINTSGTGAVAVAGSKLLVSFQFANDGSFLSGKSINNIPLKLNNGTPTLKGKVILTFDGSIFGVGDVPVEIDLDIAKS